MHTAGCFNLYIPNAEYGIYDNLPFCSNVRFPKTLLIDEVKVDVLTGSLLAVITRISILRFISSVPASRPASYMTTHCESFPLCRGLVCADFLTHGFDVFLWHKAD